MKHYMTGALGEALARSNARLDELIAVPKQKKGKKATSGCPYCFDPKLAKLGESISGGPARRLIPWLGAEFYNRASASELSRPKPVMTEETKARLKKYDAARVRDNGDPIAQMLRHREEAHCPCGKAYVRVDSWLFCRRCDVFVRAA